MTLRVVHIAAGMREAPEAPHKIDKASQEVLKSAQSAASGQISVILNQEAAITQIRSARPQQAKGEKLQAYPEAKELARDVAEEIREKDGEDVPDIDPVVAKEHLVH